MKTLTLSSKTRNLFIAGIIIGLICFGISLAIDPSRAWHGYILNYFFFLSLGIGGLFFAGTQHLTNAGWSATVRRVPESLHSWFLPSIILFIPIILFGKIVYPWMNPQMIAADHNLAMKTGYLNMPFFIIRTVLFFGLLWYLIGGSFIRNSLKQDQLGGLELTQKNIKSSAIFMPIFAILYSFISFDLIMSLDPHWYSTMFGVNCFANLFLCTIAVCVVITIKLKKAGYFGESVNENHIQTLGLLMFAFIIFYAYITFCQYMLIWYGNLPEETSYYLIRWEHHWSIYAIAIIVFKFIVPFLLLLPREAKRNMDYLLKMAYFVIFMNWIDTFWMVMPTYSTTPVFPFLEFGVFLGFTGLFGFSICRFFSRYAVLPQKDPRLQEALYLHQ